MSGNRRPSWRSHKWRPGGVWLIAWSRLARTVVGRPALVVFCASAIVYLWRTLAWPPSESPDAWAYTVWGQAVARSQRPPYSFTSTTPKPLATVLGAIASPLPPQRAFAIVVALLAAVLAAAVFSRAWADGGAVAAVGAIAAVAFLPRLNSALLSGLIDAVNAALLMVALATRGWIRVAILVAGGLLRPEAWLLAGVAGFLAAAGSLRRRLALGAAATAAPIVLWLTADMILAGDPLASLRRARELSRGAPHHDPAALLDFLWRGLRVEAGLVVLAAGLTGLVIYLVRAYRRRQLDPLLPAALVIWPLVLAATLVNAKEAFRYTLPMAALLTIGCGALLAEVPVGRRIRAAVWPAAAVSITLVAAGALNMPLPANSARQAKENQRVIASQAAVEQALTCGRLGVVLGGRSRLVTQQLAALTRRPISDFVRGGDSRRFDSALTANGRFTPPLHWSGSEVPLGTLYQSPRCQAEPVASASSAAPE
ncbi:MAG TPA: hypothetical protein VFJ24_01210 [Gaiellales bacterium]|nr:hypothetical protein [Gaiellales bacterium]